MDTSNHNHIKHLHHCNNPIIRLHCCQLKVHIIHRTYYHIYIYIHNTHPALTKTLVSSRWIHLITITSNISTMATIQSYVCTSVSWKYTSYYHTYTTHILRWRKLSYQIRCIHLITITSTISTIATIQSYVCTSVSWKYTSYTEHIIHTQHTSCADKLSRIKLDVYIYMMCIQLTAVQTYDWIVAMVDMWLCMCSCVTLTNIDVIVIRYRTYHIHNTHPATHITEWQTLSYQMYTSNHNHIHVCESDTTTYTIIKQKRKIEHISIQIQIQIQYTNTNTITNTIQYNTITNTIQYNTIQ